MHADRPDAHIGNGGDFIDVAAAGFDEASRELLDRLVKPDPLRFTAVPAIDPHRFAQEHHIGHLRVVDEGRKRPKHRAGSGSLRVRDIGHVGTLWCGRAGGCIEAGLRTTSAICTLCRTSVATKKKGRRLLGGVDAASATGRLGGTTRPQVSNETFRPD